MRPSPGIHKLVVLEVNQEVVLAEKVHAKEWETDFHMQ